MDDVQRRYMAIPHSSPVAVADNEAISFREKTEAVLNYLDEKMKQFRGSFPERIRPITLSMSDSPIDMSPGKNKNTQQSRPEVNRKRALERTEANEVLELWLKEHMDSPYPSNEEKETLSHESGLTRKQVDHWFTNARKRKISKEQKRKTAPPPHVRARLELQGQLLTRMKEADSPNSVSIESSSETSKTPSSVDFSEIKSPIETDLKEDGDIADPARQNGVVERENMDQFMSEC